MTLPGNRFGYRQHPKTIGEPLQPVEVVKESPKRFSKIRIRYLDGELAGLEEWVPKGRLICPWEDAGALMDDEQRKLALLCDVQTDMVGTIPYQAIRLVFGATSQRDTPYLGWTSSDENLLRIEDFETTVQAMNLPGECLLGYPHAFVDRCHVYWGPYEAAEGLAKTLCRQNPRAVAQGVSREEAELRSRAVHGANQGLREYAEERLSKQGPVFALARRWCGETTASEFDEIGALQDEVARLRKLIEKAAGRWAFDGHPKLAAELLEEMNAGNSECDLLGWGSWRPASEREYAAAGHKPGWGDPEAVASQLPEISGSPFGRRGHPRGRV